jgi:cytochrome c oxidase subunit 2
MPIAVEAVPMDKFNAFILSQGGTLKGAKPALPAAAAPRQEPESSVEGAPGAGQAPGPETPKTNAGEPATPAPAA